MQLCKIKLEYPIFGNAEDATESSLERIRRISSD